MLFQNSYNLVLNSLRIGYASKQFDIVIFKNKQVVQFLTILNRVRYIRFFRNIENNKIRVFLNYRNNKPLLNFSKLIFKKSNLRRISCRNICRLYKYDLGVIYILSTPLGLLTQSEALRMHVGGILVCVLY